MARMHPRSMQCGKKYPEQFYYYYNYYIYYKYNYNNYYYYYYYYYRLTVLGSLLRGDNSRRW